MTPDTITEHLQLAAVTAAAEADRRRIGRQEVAPELIPLLRYPFSAADAVADRVRDHRPRDDALALGKSLVAGALMATTFWAAIAILAAALLH